MKPRRVYINRASTPSINRITTAAMSPTVTKPVTLKMVAEESLIGEQSKEILTTKSNLGAFTIKPRRLYVIPTSTNRNTAAAAEKASEFPINEKSAATTTNFPDTLADSETEIFAEKITTETPEYNRTSPGFTTILKSARTQELTETPEVTRVSKIDDDEDYATDQTEIIPNAKMSVDKTEIITITNTSTENQRPEVTRAGVFTSASGSTDQDYVTFEDSFEPPMGLRNLSETLDVDYSYPTNETFVNNNNTEVMKTDSEDNAAAAITIIVIIILILLSIFLCFVYWLSQNDYQIVPGIDEIAKVA